MRVGGQDAVALVERHVQRVLRPRERRRRARDEQRERRTRPREQEAASGVERGDERDRSGHGGARDEQRPLAGERSGDEEGERRGRDLLHAGERRAGPAQLGEQPDRDHEPGERPVADVAHLRALVDDPRARRGRPRRSRP